MKNGQSLSTRWGTMLAVTFGLLMTAFDASSLNLALPAIQQHLGLRFSQAQWILLAYTLTVVSLMLICGRLADMYGRKRLYSAGFILFGLGALLSSLMRSPGLLIAARVVQACGGVLLLALGSAVLAQVFPPNHLGLAMGISAMVIALGQITGPLIGGALLQHYGWRSIFLVHLPLGMAGALLTWRQVPADSPGEPQKLDFAGAVVAFCGLFGFLLALSLGQREGWTQPQVWGLLFVSVCSFVVFLPLERSASQPLIPLQAFRNPALNIRLASTLLSYMAYGGSAVLFSYYLQTTRAMPPARAGALMMAAALAMAVMSPLAGLAAGKVGVQFPTIGGLLTLMMGYLAAAQLNEATPWWYYVFCTGLIGLGMGAFQAPNNSAVMLTSTRQHLGSVSGVLAMVRQLGQMLGIALLGVVWSTRPLSVAEPGAGTGLVARGSGLALLLAAILAGLATAANLWLLRLTGTPKGRNDS